MVNSNPQIEERIDRLHRPGLVDLHFDLLMDLYERRTRANMLVTDFLPDLEAGGVSVIGAAIYLEDRYLPEMGLRVPWIRSRGCMRKSINRIASPSAKLTWRFLELAPPEKSRS